MLLNYLVVSLNLVDKIFSLNAVEGNKIPLSTTIILKHFLKQLYSPKTLAYRSIFSTNLEDTTRNLSSL